MAPPGRSSCSQSPDAGAADHSRDAAGRLGTRPVALSVAGSDSGGGAGIQADLAAFAFFKVFGTTAVTAVTAQNPATVSGICAVDADTVTAQIEAVFAAFSVRAVKTGMLFSADIVRAVSACLRSGRRGPTVVDPVMVATSGARLLREDAIRELTESLLPLAAVITPNLPEAEILCGRALRTRQEIREAARRMAGDFGAVVAVKGGHVAGGPAVDTVSDGEHTWELSAPRAAAPTTHGTGCSLSAAVAASLACGADIPSALRNAKAYVLGCLRNCVKVGPRAWVPTAPPALPLEDILVHEC